MSGGYWMKKLLRSNARNAVIPIIILILIIAGIGAAIWGGGIGYTTDISRIQADPVGWDGKQVYVKGTVTSLYLRYNSSQVRVGSSRNIYSFGFYGFVLDSGTNEIYVDCVYCEGCIFLPSLGDKVIASGTVHRVGSFAYIEATSVRNAWF
jgi:hypothetical protein